MQFYDRTFRNVRGIVQCLRPEVVHLLKGLEKVCLTKELQTWCLLCQASLYWQVLIEIEAKVSTFPTCKKEKKIGKIQKRDVFTRFPLSSHFVSSRNRSRLFTLAGGASCLVSFFPIIVFHRHCFQGVRVPGHTLQCFTRAFCRATMSCQQPRRFFFET